MSKKDPKVLYTLHKSIRTWHEGGGKGHLHGHLLNLGHGVLQGTPEESIQYFVDAAKATKLPLA